MKLARDREVAMQMQPGSSLLNTVQGSIRLTDTKDLASIKLGAAIEGHTKIIIKYNNKIAY